MKARLAARPATDRRPLGRWFGVLVAVPLAAGGPNSACEADTPPPGAQAEQRADEQNDEHNGERDDAKDDAKDDKDKREKAKDDTDAEDEGRDSSRDVVCVVSADAPTFDADNARFIVGTAKYWCESPGADHLTVVVRVQRRHDDGTWITVASSRDTVGGRQTIRIEGRDEPVGWAKTSCRAGTFRTVVVAKRKADGDVKVVVDNSFQTTDPCEVSGAGEWPWG